MVKVLELLIQFKICIIDIQSILAYGCQVLLNYKKWMKNLIWILKVLRKHSNFYPIIAVVFQPHVWARMSKTLRASTCHPGVSHPLPFFQSFLLHFSWHLLFLNITQRVTINGWHFSLLATWQNTRVNTRSERAAKELDIPANNKAKQRDTSRHPEGELQRETQPQLLKLVEIGQRTRREKYRQQITKEQRCNCKSRSFTTVNNTKVLIKAVVYVV